MRWRAACLVAVIALAHPPRARADEPPSPGDSAERLREAKSLFQEGNMLRKAGDLQGALEFYQRSRRLVPSMPNTLNAAYCLEQLGRTDELLELYEEILTKFRGELSPQEQQQLSLSMSVLRRKLGSIDVLGDVGGMLLVDGRVRGTLPIVAPVHVQPGQHTVRVFKEGWEPFERTVTVGSGQTVPIDASLMPLRQAGRLRIETDNVVGAELLLDDAPLGTLPWEGTLAPGPHLFSVRKDGLGSAPARANVVQGQRVVVAVHGLPLGPEVRVVVEPASADMWIDGVPIGKGQWRGALPLGTHMIEAREVGYVSARVEREIAPRASSEILLSLPVDPNHPRWATTRSHGTLHLAALGGVALGPTFGGDAGAYCARGQCSRNSWATGALVGIRGMYVFPSGIFVQWTGGYVTLHKDLARQIDGSFTVRASGTVVPVSYQLDDALSLSGPFVAGGVGYVHPLRPRLSVHGAIDVGALMISVRDDVGGTASAGGRTLAVSIGASGSPVRSAAPLLLPEVGLDYQVGSFDAGIALAAAIFPLEGPSLPTGEARVYGGSCRDHPGTADCAPGTTAIAHERGNRQFVLIIPTVKIGYRF
jgi:hypothetical protein